MSKAKSKAKEFNETKYLNSILPRVTGYCEAAVNHHFVGMLNPKNRGTNFRWENFVDFAIRISTASVYQCFSDKEWKEFGKEIDADAEKHCRIVAERVMKESAILDWWEGKLPQNQIGE